MATSTFEDPQVVSIFDVLPAIHLNSRPSSATIHNSSDTDWFLSQTIENNRNPCSPIIVTLGFHERAYRFFPSVLIPMDCN